MFRRLQPAPPDAILDLSESFRMDSNPNKINLAVGVFKNEDGETPILECVRESERRLLTEEKSKSYLPIDGSADFDNLAAELILGTNHRVREEGRAATAQTPGGTGALRMAADLIRRISPGARIWISDPTWANHPHLFAAAGLDVQTYPYFDRERNLLDTDALLGSLERIPEGDVLLLHGCCHNPTGVDLTPDLWHQIGAICRTKLIVPLIDFAYQGFADGLDEDAFGVRLLAEEIPTLMVASSASKNFGLYNERVGALTLVAPDKAAARAGLSHVKRCIRTSYSNPPAHGAKIVSHILADDELTRLWRQEVEDMRKRIRTMRDLFVATLREMGATKDFEFIRHQNGMFSFSGLNPEQVQALRDRHSVYIVGSGRINVAGMTSSNMEYLCRAIADVVDVADSELQRNGSRT